MTLRVGVGLFTGQAPPGSGRTWRAEYRDSLALARVAEHAGLDGVWVNEHHNAADGYLPSPLALLAAFAAVTARVELGTGVMLAPFHHPLRLAEDAAVVDALSGGRLVLGLGAGWRSEEFRSFGVDARTRVRRLTETVEILGRAWTGERFSYSGRIFRFDDVVVTPRPARPPPVLVGGFADAAIRRAGRIADGFVASNVGLERVRESFELAAAARAEAGRPGPPAVAAFVDAWVSDDAERDWPLVRRAVAYQKGLHAGWQEGADTAAVPPLVVEHGEAELRATTVIGGPDDVARALEPLARLLGRYGDARLIVRLHYPGLPLGLVASAIDAFGRAVAPRLRA